MLAWWSEQSALEKGLLAVAAGVALMRFKVNVVLVIVACAALGLARGLLA